MFFFRLSKLLRKTKLFHFNFFKTFFFEIIIRSSHQKWKKHEAKTFSVLVYSRLVVVFSNCKKLNFWKKLRKLLRYLREVSELCWYEVVVNERIAIENISKVYLFLPLFICPSFPFLRSSLSCCPRVFLSARMCFIINEMKINSKTSSS